MKSNVREQQGLSEGQFPSPSPQSFVKTYPADTVVANKAAVANMLVASRTIFALLFEYAPGEQLADLRGRRGCKFGEASKGNY